MQEVANGLVNAIHGMITSATLEEFFQAYVGWAIFVTLAFFAPFYVIFIAADIFDFKLPKHLTKVQKQLYGWNLWAAALPFILVYYAIYYTGLGLRRLWQWFRS